MDLLGGLNLPPQATAIVGIAFMVALGVFAAWARLFGKKEGAPQPKVQEFFASGRITDMGPVKELIESHGHLIQQQARTNAALEHSAKLHERTNVELARIAVVLIDHVAEQKKDRASADLEDEIERRARKAAENMVRELEEEKEERRKSTRRPTT